MIQGHTQNDQGKAVSNRQAQSGSVQMVNWSQQQQQQHTSMNGSSSSFLVSQPMVAADNMQQRGQMQPNFTDNSSNVQLFSNVNVIQVQKVPTQQQQQQQQQGPKVVSPLLVDLLKNENAQAAVGGVLSNSTAQGQNQSKPKRKRQARKPKKAKGASNAATAVPSAPDTMYMTQAGLQPQQAIKNFVQPMQHGFSSQQMPQQQQFVHTVYQPQQQQQQQQLLLAQQQQQPQNRLLATVAQPLTSRTVMNVTDDNVFKPNISMKPQPNMIMPQQQPGVITPQYTMQTQQQSINQTDILGSNQSSQQQMGLYDPYSQQQLPTHMTSQNVSAMQNPAFQNSHFGNQQVHLTSAGGTSKGSFIKNTNIPNINNNNSKIVQGMKSGAEIKNKDVYLSLATAKESNQIVSVVSEARKGTASSAFLVRGSLSIIRKKSCSGVTKKLFKPTELLPSQVETFKGDLKTHRQKCYLLQKQQQQILHSKAVMLNKKGKQAQQSKQIPMYQKPSKDVQQTAYQQQQHRVHHQPQSLQATYMQPQPMHQQQRIIHQTMPLQQQQPQLVQHVAKQGINPQLPQSQQQIMQQPQHYQLPKQQKLLQQSVPNRQHLQQQRQQYIIKQQQQQLMQHHKPPQHLMPQNQPVNQQVLQQQQILQQQHLQQQSQPVNQQQRPSSRQTFMPMRSPMADRMSATPSPNYQMQQSPQLLASYATQSRSPLPQHPTSQQPNANVIMRNQSNLNRPVPSNEMKPQQSRVIPIMNKMPVTINSFPSSGLQPPQTNLQANITFTHPSTAATAVNVQQTQPQQNWQQQQHAQQSSQLYGGGGGAATTGGTVMHPFQRSQVKNFQANSPGQYFNKTPQISPQQFSETAVQSPSNPIVSSPYPVPPSTPPASVRTNSSMNS